MRDMIKNKKLLILLLLVILQFTILILRYEEQFSFWKHVRDYAPLTYEAENAVRSSFVRNLEIILLPIIILFLIYLPLITVYKSLQKSRKFFKGIVLFILIIILMIANLFLLPHRYYVKMERYSNINNTFSKR